MEGALHFLENGQASDLRSKVFEEALGAIAYRIVVYERLGEQLQFGAVAIERKMADQNIRCDTGFMARHGFLGN